MADQLQDSFNRKFYYLRLSVTDVCNFRCTYCLPDGYRPHQTKSHFLNVNELRQVVSAFAACGTSKIRLTGGEPTLRKDFADILAMIAEQPKIEKIALTTNGYRLERDVKTWYSLGLNQLNVSLDSLDPRQFHQITGQNKFHQVMAGIDAAFNAGYAQVKVNAVLLKDLNSAELPAFLAWIKRRPIQLRFIELMQTGDMDTLFAKHHQSGMNIRHYLIANGWSLKAKAQTDGPAEIYTHSDYQGEIGLIMPYSKNFCASCNRLRVSANGKLHLCLFGDDGVELRDLLQTDAQQAALIERLQLALRDKKQRHYLEAGYTGMTPHLAAIGG